MLLRRPQCNHISSLELTCGTWGVLMAAVQLASESTCHSHSNCRCHCFGLKRRSNFSFAKPPYPPCSKNSATLHKQHNCSRFFAQTFTRSDVIWSCFPIHANTQDMAPSGTDGNQLQDVFSGGRVTNTRRYSEMQTPPDVCDYDIFRCWRVCGSSCDHSYN